MNNISYEPMAYSNSELTKWGVSMSLPFATKHYLKKSIFRTISFFELISAKITRSHVSWKNFGKLPARGRRALCVLVGYTMTNKQFRRDSAKITRQKRIGAKVTEIFR